MMGRDLALAAGAFAAATLLAELLGATNLGTALTFGSIAFMATIVGLIVARGPQRGAGAGDADGRRPGLPARKPPPPPPRSRAKRR